MTSNVSRLALATAAGVVCLFISDHWSSTIRSSLITQADAEVGQPLSAASVAGVHRRASRRAYRREHDYGVGAGVATAAGVTVGVAAGTAATGAYVEPAPAAYPASAPDAVMAPPGASATVTDPATGRTCTISTSGYRWCWTP